MTIFGGVGPAGVLRMHGFSLMQMDLVGVSSWTQLGTFSVFAEARYGHTAVYNPSTNKMTIFG
jgi:hypothetical protein